jgi:hypothetical protein
MCRLKKENTQREEKACVRYVCYSNRIIGSKFVYHVILIRFDIISLNDGTSPQDTFIYA